MCSKCALSHGIVRGAQLLRCVRGCTLYLSHLGLLSAAFAEVLHGETLDGLVDLASLAHLAAGENFDLLRAKIKFISSVQGKMLEFVLDVVVMHWWCILEFGSALGVRACVDLSGL